jgi:hypothetical protein
MRLSLPGVFQDARKWSTAGVRPMPSSIQVVRPTGRPPESPLRLPKSGKKPARIAAVEGIGALGRAVGEERERCVGPERAVEFGLRA